MSLDRRAFLLRSAATLGAGGLADAGAHTLLGGGDARAASPPSDGVDPGLSARVPFDGEHQAGILTPPPEQATFVALDAIAPDRATLAIGLQALSSRARELTQGSSIPAQEVDDPPVDSGTLGTTIAPDALTVTIAFGASLFDDRYGLAGRRPPGLTTMAPFPHDDLDPARCHGDVLLQICAGRRDTVVHTVRELLRPVRGAFALRWTVDGFQGAHRGPSARSSRRNHFGFRDGTGNPDVGDDALMRRLLWVDDGDPGPAWAAGGTYQVLRAIRMHVEFWDRVGLREQENMIGRTRDSGAPLGGTGEYEDPHYELDPQGERIPLDAHIRLSNPRTAKTDDQRILRRGYGYHRGFDEAGQLDMGLVFVAFNRDVERQFATIQRRLADEPMIDYVTPVGGGYFFAPRGTRDAADWVGSGLFA